MAKILFDRSFGKSVEIKRELALVPPVSKNVYFDRLVKMIPSEIITLYFTLNALNQVFPANARIVYDWCLFALIVIAGAFYLYKFSNVKSASQLILTTLAIAIWVFTIGGPFKSFAWYNQAYGEIATTLYTFIIPFFFKAEQIG